MIDNKSSRNNSPMFFHKAFKSCPIKMETKNRANKSLVSLSKKRLTFQNLQEFCYFTKN